MNENTEVAVVEIDPATGLPIVRDGEASQAETTLPEGEVRTDVASNS